MPSNRSLTGIYYIWPAYYQPDNDHTTAPLIFEPRCYVNSRNAIAPFSPLTRLF